MYHRVDRDSSLWKFLQECLAAYNHRTDVMEASTDVAIQRQIDAAVADLRSSTTSVEQAIADDTKGK